MGKTFAELIRGYKALHDEGAVLLDRIKRIKDECEEKKFDEALSLLRSRFWTFRPLRNLLRTYPEVDKNFRALFENTGTMSPEDRHRFQWYVEHRLDELARHESEREIFAADALKELSRDKNVGIGKLLFHLKKKYDPKTAEEVKSSLKRIERELIDLVHFTETDLRILNEDEAIIQLRAKQVEEKIRSLKNLEHSFVEAIHTVLTEYNKKHSIDLHNLIDWTKTEIKPTMLGTMLDIKTVIHFQGSLSYVTLESSFRVKPNDVKPGEFKVSTWAPDPQDWVNTETKNLEGVAVAFKTYRARLSTALRERADSEDRRMRAIGIHPRAYQ